MNNIELIYAHLDKTLFHVHLSVPVGLTVREVIIQSNILSIYPEVAELAVGIFSKMVDYETLVKSGDRLEIYRPLVINPMDKRRQRATKSAFKDRE